MPRLACGVCGSPNVTAPAQFCSTDCYRVYQRRTAAETLVDRFWSKVNKNTATGCWLWTASTVRGYGQWSFRDAEGVQHATNAHRFAWELLRGPIPAGKCLCHDCPGGDNPLCLNPDHLFVGTIQENLNDARAKRRLIDGNHLVKVDDAGVADIRANYVPRKNGKQLAAKYGIHIVSLLRIVRGTQRIHPLQTVTHRLATQREQAAAKFPPLHPAVAKVFERVPHVDLPVHDFNVDRPDPARHCNSIETRRSA
jgi:hypothetical protein